MSNVQRRTGLQLRSLVKHGGELELSIATVAVPEVGPDEVLVRIEASPLNPSDIGLLFGGADMRTVNASGTAERPMITARIPDAAMNGLASRLNVSMPVGFEGAGVVIEAGSSTAAQALLGKTVAALGSGMHSQYCCVLANQCMVLPEGATAADGASALVNPLTVLGMVETMRIEGHTALVHTAAASNLGQMLNRVCRKDGIGLVNIVRKREQEVLLRAAGAVHVCNVSSDSFSEDLAEALAATGATIAFDAIGGGKLVGQILTCMESVQIRGATTYSRYGSTVHKQVYLYGGMDTSPTEFSRDFGMAWGVAGWLVFPFLQKIGPAAVQALKRRIAGELKTTFASSYLKEISLTEALELDTIEGYGKRATGAKYLLNPSKIVVDKVGL